MGSAQLGARWCRDINSPRSIVLNYRTMLEHGDVPYPFRRSTKAENLLPSAAAMYRYIPVPGRADNKFLCVPLRTELGKAQ